MVRGETREQIKKVDLSTASLNVVIEKEINMEVQEASSNFESSLLKGTKDPRTLLEEMSELISDNRICYLNVVSI